MNKYTTNNPEQTKQLAKSLASRLKGGETIGLIGDLGAGKTVFVQGLAKAFGIKETVNSPTFVLLKVYKITQNSCLRAVAKMALARRRPTGKAKLKTLVHIDCYRLSDSQELLNIGVQEYLGRKDTVVVIEWADRVQDLLPKDSMIIEIKEGAAENEKIIEINSKP